MGLKRQLEIIVSGWRFLMKTRPHAQKECSFQHTAAGTAISIKLIN